MENGNIGIKMEKFEVKNITKKIWKKALGRNGMKTEK